MRAKKTKCWHLKKFGFTFPASFSFLFFIFFSSTYAFISALYSSIASGMQHCCPTSALITASERPPSTSRLACESTCPRGIITLKSSKSGHVKLREVFQEPTQVSEGVSGKLEAIFACQNTLKLHDKKGLKVSCSL